jgi:hypothetical protein
MKEPEEIPDPSGEPVAVEESELPHKEGSSGGVAGLLLLGAVGAFTLLTMGSPLRAKGATTSTQLKWSDRQAEIESAIQQENASAATKMDDESSAPTD